MKNLLTFLGIGCLWLMGLSPEAAMATVETSGFQVGVNHIDPFDPWLQLNPSYHFELVPGLACSIEATIGAYYSNKGVWFRDAAGTWIVNDAQAFTQVPFTRLGLEWGLSLEQMVFSPQDLFRGLSLVLGYRGQYQENRPAESPANSLVFTSGLSDAQGFQLNSVFFGLKWYDVTKNRALNIQSGNWTELTAETGNGFFRLGAVIKNYLPLLESPDLALYLGEMAAFDLDSGPNIPMAVRQSMASLSTFGGGYTGVAGLSMWGSEAHDGTMKLSHSLDLRLMFPRLIDPNFMPGLVAFYDCGWYDNLDWQFSMDRFDQTLGASLVVHGDSALVFPFSIAADLSIGVAWRVRWGDFRLLLETSLAF